ncbi:MAG: hypothetical protein E3J60_04510, partial [Dehalococcoidia bacterium]
MALVFDEIDRTIVIEAPQTEVAIQDLINAIRDWEDELVNLDEPSLANASGKQNLGGGVLVGITLELINNWRVQFEGRLGPDYVSCRISGGNLVATNDYDDNPIKPSAFTQIYIAQSSSATSIEAGGALTDEEHDQLMLKTALEASVQNVKSQSDRMKFAGEDIKATLDNEKVDLDDKTKEKIEVTQKDMQHTKKQADFIRNIEEGRWLIKKNQM